VIAVGALSLDSDLLALCYIAAFSLFILGIRQGTHPKTARRGNLLAAAGMAIAVGATLATDVIGNWGIILTAIAAGTAVGWIASARVAMTDMPQMVALYNGLGGGAVALIAWSEFRDIEGHGGLFELDVFIPILFSMVIGSISFWGSNIAFGKLQGILPQRSVSLPGQQFINGSG
jgi:NAD(P) transhydrogenase subunit beta